MRLPRWLPEALLAVTALFFVFRELGTFPAVWNDDGLFMIVAKSFASGHGYVMPILGREWAYPYFLAVGPTLILPVALSMKLFGISALAARIPMALYLLGASALFYVLANRLTNRTAARYGTALLITLSAFVNTGKPVLGEIPAAFFLLLGLLLWPRAERSFAWSILCGAVLGLAILTKLTYGLVLPAIGVAWILTCTQRQWRISWKLAIIGVTAFLVFLPWRILEASQQPGLLGEFLFLLGGTGENPVPFLTIPENPSILLRFPFFAYAFFLITGSIGMRRVWIRDQSRLLTVIASMIALFTLYFLTSFGWYRHILFAHILLLPFVPVGVLYLFRKRVGSVVLLLIIFLQTAWQWDHRGASSSTYGAAAAAWVREEYADKDLIIQQAEVFAVLPENLHWLYLTNPILSRHLPTHFVTPDERHRCMPVLRRLSEEDRKEFFGRLIPVAGPYFLVEPPAHCL